MTLCDRCPAEELRGDLDGILSALPDIVFELAADGTYLYVHTPEGLPYSPKTHGPPDGMVGKNLYDVLPKEGAELALKAMNEALATRKLVHAQWSRPFPDGVVRHYDARAVPTSRGTCVVLVRDETDRVNALNELRRSNEDLQQFAYVASHDLQEPIRGMFVSAQVILEDLEPQLSEEHRKWLYRIRDNAVRLQRMVRDLLQFSRAGTNFSTTPVWFDAYEEIRGIQEDFKARIDETKATITVQAIPWVYYDRTMFRVVLGNLLSNALKFCRKGVPPKISIDGHGTMGGMVTLVIKDNGIGIPKDKQRSIFEPGRRLHHRSVYPGSGLGLASVARIIRRCGGDLGLRSSEGEGTEFYFTLPGGVPNVDGKASPDR